jgi:hypothetical protein
VRSAGKQVGPAIFLIRFRPATVPNFERFDASVYILALPPAEAEREHWQIAMEFLISAAENGGIVMIARIAMLRALNAGKPDPEITPRRKRPKRYRIVAFQQPPNSLRFYCLVENQLPSPPSYSPQDIKTKYC